MKKFKTNNWLTLVLLVVILSTVLMACEHSDQPFVIITNPLGQARPDAQITILRDSLDKHYPNLLDHFLFKNEAGETIAYQLDDLDGDNKWDELALLCSLEGNKSKKLYFKHTEKNKIPNFTDRANIWFARLDSATQKYQSITHEVRPDWYHRIIGSPFYYQFEGPGWENDNIGFRMYFDQRNAIDIWGKQTSKMALKKVGLQGDNYHELSSWGMDVLHVGNTLGAGGIAAIKNDSLYHLGATDRTVFKQIVDGPVRAIFDIKYTGWHLGNDSYSICERISIWGGQQGYTNKISLLNSKQLTLVTGIGTAKLPGAPDFSNKQDFPYVIGWGRQSEHNDYLGMAVVGTSGSFMGHGQKYLNPGSVDSSAFLKYNVKSNQPLMYRFVAGSEISNRKFAQKSYFMDAVRDEGERFNHPVEIEYH